MKLDWGMLSGLRVTVMGLGLHGGGAAAAAFFARHGSEVTVTDLMSEAELSQSIDSLERYPIRYVLGRHDAADFESADVVIKNPAVGLDSPFLWHARWVESDISVFLSLVDNPLLAVTGTKGKSTTASAMHFALEAGEPGARLGGNITMSPLTFADQLAKAPVRPPVVLELSSWQLADLRGKGVLKPRVAVITNILPDHLNRYARMEDYVADKAVIFSEQTANDITVCNFDNAYTRRFGERTPAKARYFSAFPLAGHQPGAWIEGPQGPGVIRTPTGVVEILPERIALPGAHNRMNLLAAGLALFSLGANPALTRGRLAEFRGIRHRLELVAEIDGRRFYNDSAATIPEAAAAAVESFNEPVILIAGGTDKALDFAPFLRLSKPPKHVVLLAGSATPKLSTALQEAGIPQTAAYGTIEAALANAVKRSEDGDVVVLSPGCASFEMFKNEFDRGDRFAAAVEELRSGRSARRR